VTRLIQTSIGDTAKRLRSMLDDLGRQDGASVGYDLIERLLYETGRPLVFIPAFGAFETLGRHIVIEWNASRSATRAVNDTLPLIERTERITVLTMDSADFPDRDGGPAAVWSSISSVIIQRSMPCI
jgi:hypothetical protein